MEGNRQIKITLANTDKHQQIQTNIDKYLDTDRNGY